MIHHSRRIYPNGSIQDNGVSSELLAQHIWYNQTFRPGTVLIVDGHQVSDGCGTVDKELIEKHIAAVKAGENKPNRDTRPYS